MLTVDDNETVDNKKINLTRLFKDEAFEIIGHFCV